MSTGDIHNHNGSICTASKRPCPFGEEGHSKDIDSYVDYHVNESGVDGDQVRAMIADGTPPADAVEVAKTGAQASPKLQKTVDELKLTPEGADRFQAYKAQWQQFWGKLTPGVRPERAAALEARKTPGVYDGAWIEPREDGSMEIPAGDYVLVAEGLFVDDAEEPGVDAWNVQALVTTPPGTVGGAYLEGKPAYFLTSANMGDNHGYDGDALLPRETYDRLLERGVIDDTGDSIKVEKDTVLYGELGNPKLAPEKAYDWTSENRNQYWDEETMDFDDAAVGTIRNHPSITMESNN